MAWNLSSVPPVWTSVGPHALRGPFLHGNLYLLPHENHREPQPDGRKEGALEGKCCVFPRAQCYFLNGFGFYHMLLVTLLNKKSRGREMKQTAQNCLK